MSRHDMGPSLKRFVRHLPREHYAWLATPRSGLDTSLRYLWTTGRLGEHANVPMPRSRRCTASVESSRNVWSYFGYSILSCRGPAERV